MTKQERLEKLNDELESISNRRTKESQHSQRQSTQSTQSIIFNKEGDLTTSAFVILLIGLLGICGLIGGFIWYQQ